MSAPTGGPDDALAAAEAKLERLLKDHGVRPLKRALYGHMYRAMRAPTFEDLEWLIARLEERAAAA